MNTQLFYSDLFFKLSDENISQIKSSSLIDFKTHKLQVIDNIREILNTKIAPIWKNELFELPFAFGLSIDTSLYTDDATIESIKRKIIFALEKYEKRISNIECCIERNQKDCFKLDVKIKCKLETQYVEIEIKT